VRLAPTPAMKLRRLTVSLRQRGRLGQPRRQLSLAPSRLSIPTFGGDDTTFDMIKLDEFGPLED